MEDKQMKTIKFTKQELHMLTMACSEFVLGFSEGWEHSGYTQEEIKSYYNAEKKLKDADYD